MHSTRTESLEPAAGVSPYWFTLPSDFTPETTLPPGLRAAADNARYLVDLIIRKIVCRDVDERGYVHLHSAVLRRTMMQRSRAGIIKTLRGQGVLETSPHCAGRFSRGYRLADGFLALRPERRACRDLRLLSRIHKERQRFDSEERGPWLPIHDRLATIQRCIGVDPSADAVLESLEPAAKFCQSVLIENIRRGEFSLHVSQYGRVFNSITGVKRALRPALRIRRQRMGSVDLSCAQPALLALLMLAHPTTGLFPVATYKASPVRPPSCRLPRPSVASPVASSSAGADFGFFRDLVCSGEFNNWLAEATRLEKQDSATVVL